MKTALWSALLLGLLAISHGQAVKPAIVNGQDAPRGRHVPRTRLVVHAAVRSTSLFRGLREGQGGRGPSHMMLLSAGSDSTALSCTRLPRGRAISWPVA